MCISIAPVTFGNTVTGLYEADENTHVIFYQNTVSGASNLRRSRSGGTPVLSMTAPAKRGRRSAPKTPSNWNTGRTAGSEAANGNALVIPLLTDNFDSIKLLRETANTPNLLKDIRRAVQPPASRGGLRRGGGKGISFGVDTVVIESFDIYTLVLASRASLIPDAVKSIESRKRPPLAKETFAALEQWYDCPFAVACFNNEDAGEAKPIAYAYEPKYPDQFLIYTLDGHDGTVPDLNATVELDHAVFVGSYRASTGRPVSYGDYIPGTLKQYLPAKVVGTAFQKGTRLINGDILVAVDDVVEGKFEAFRVLPPNAPDRAPVSLAEALKG
jgi:hypothetical protein